jgi:hypothetical protein
MASVHPFQEHRCSIGIEDVVTEGGCRLKEGYQRGIKSLKRHLPTLVELRCSIDVHQHSYARSVSVSANETLLRISGEDWWSC